ncbi:hypothetical protein C8F01DRAFT_1233665 [Mycena amicta]|nr:hypothetical protein C8F01DRAFT_1233665 [Mycena amicta]
MVNRPLPPVGADDFMMGRSEAEKPAMAMVMGYRPQNLAAAGLAGATNFGKLRATWKSITAGLIHALGRTKELIKRYRWINTKLPTPRMARRLELQVYDIRPRYMSARIQSHFTYEHRECCPRYMSAWIQSHPGLRAHRLHSPSNRSLSQCLPGYSSVPSSLTRTSRPLDYCTRREICVEEHATYNPYSDGQVKGERDRRRNKCRVEWKQVQKSPASWAWKRSETGAYHGIDVQTRDNLATPGNNSAEDEEPNAKLEEM